MSELGRVILLKEKVVQDREVFESQAEEVEPSAEAQQQGHRRMTRAHGMWMSREGGLQSESGVWTLMVHPVWQSSECPYWTQELRVP